MWWKIILSERPMVWWSSARIFVFLWSHLRERFCPKWSPIWPGLPVPTYVYLHIYLSLSKKLIFNDRYHLSPTLPTTLCRLVISHRPEPCAQQAPSRSIKFYFNLLNLLNRLMVASEKSCPRPPAPPAAWIHQIHTAGGASSSITMVMVFVCCLCFFVPSRLVVVTRRM